MRSGDGRYDRPRPGLAYGFWTGAAWAAVRKKRDRHEQRFIARKVGWRDSAADGWNLNIYEIQFFLK